MIGIDIGAKTFPLPENWEEVVAAGKYLDVVRINFTHTPEQEPAARAALVAALSGLDGYELGKAAGTATGKQRAQLAENLNDFFALQILEEIYPVLDFIFKPDLLTQNPLPVINFKGKAYYGPGEKLAEQTGAEMEECGFAHAEFIKTGEEEYLNQLVAAMYPPKGKEFSVALTKEQTKLFTKMDPIQKRGVLLYYQMCEEWWRQNFEALYEGGAAPAPPADGEEGPVVDSLAVSRIIRALAGGKRGTVEQVRQMQRQEIYFELMELQREADALQK